jgi:ABC-type transporter Mla MlaB component
MRFFKSFLFVVLALVPLGSCQVPDTTPFATATTEMTTALRAALGHAHSELNLAVQLDPNATTDGLVAQQQEYGKGQAAINTALASFDAYAGTLSELADAGTQGKANIDKVATALAGVATALGPSVGIVGNIASNSIKLLDGLVQTIRTQGSLKRATVPADAGIQQAAAILAADLRQLARIDSAANAIGIAQLTNAQGQVLKSYRDVTIRQAHLDSAASLVVAFDIVATHINQTSNEDTKRRYQQRQQELLSELAKLDHQTATYATDLRQGKLRQVLAALDKREIYYRRELGLSQLQPRYDAALAKLAASEATRRQGASLFEKSQSTVAAWARAHTALKTAIIKERHTVSVQEALSAAKDLKEFVNTIQAAGN